MTRLIDRRLLFITGKGGVGKTAIAAGLGLMASAEGKRVLVCELEPRGDLSKAFDCGPTAFTPRTISEHLSVMTMDTEASLVEYLKIHLRPFGVARFGPLASMLDFVATAAPGVREILTVGKLCYEVKEDHYDLVIADASATGHVVGQLAAPLGINDLVKVGAIRQQTDWMLEILQDHTKTAVCIVSSPEEMPVSEAIDLVGRIERGTQMCLGAVFANRVLPELFASSDEVLFASLGASSIQKTLAEALGLSRQSKALTEVFAAARLAVGLRRTGAEHLERLRAQIPADVPIYNVPYLFNRTQGPRSIRQIARLLEEELS